MSKVANYTPENVAVMREVYQAASTEAERSDAMDTLAEMFGKTVASVRSKLSHEGVYIAKVKAEKSGTTRVLKSDKVDEISAFAGNANDQFFESLAGVNKGVLDYVLALQAEVGAYRLRYLQRLGNFAILYRLALGRKLDG